MCVWKEEEDSTQTVDGVKACLSARRLHESCEDDVNKERVSSPIVRRRSEPALLSLSPSNSGSDPRVQNNIESYSLERQQQPNRRAKSHNCSTRCDSAYSLQEANQWNQKKFKILNQQTIKRTTRYKSMPDQWFVRPFLAGFTCACIHSHQVSHPSQ